MGNCLYSAGLAFVWCRVGCSKTKIAAMAYHPPSPSYEITRSVDELANGKDTADSASEPAQQTEGEPDAGSSATALAEPGAGVVSPKAKPEYTMRFIYQDLQAFLGGMMSQVEPTRITTQSGSSIPAVFVPAPDGGVLTLLYSHGNAVDIGEMLPFWLMLSRSLNVNVFGYEYTGYGDSRGPPEQPTEGQTYLDIEAAYAALIKRVPANTVVLYGQSVGSGPSCHMAGRGTIAGVVLHSGLMSGLNVLRPPQSGSCLASCCAPSCLLCCCDVYRNIDKISNFTCPVCILHGRDDEVIAFQHAERLYAKCRPASKSEPYWPAGARHNDLVEHNHDAYISRLNTFLRALESSLQPAASDAAPTPPTGAATPVTAM